MFTKTSIASILLGAGSLTVAGILFSSKADANLGTISRGTASYQVEITNLTRAQQFSPALLASHNSNIAMFTPGEAASPELADLAENGANALLKAVLDGSPDVLMSVSDVAGVAPGDTTTLTIDLSTSHPYLSIAGMLISTNDTFYGLNSATCPPSKQSVTFYVPGYDAGSEFNSEDCAYIPGPPCGAGAVHDPTPAEGFVYINNGIQGIGGVPNDTYDWRNPVARIVVTRL